jgi:2-C-methyl-D-erythritol 2,4-cyclodiphosphate synthase
LEIRVGQGFDVHALVPDRPLILAGVTIPHETGLLGHSDADVLLHAITDALLGAAGLDDIGTHFPDNDPAYKNADSRQLLRQVVTTIKSKGWRIVNVDATVIAQAPKIRPHVTQMRSHLFFDLGLPPECVNIKGKTTEWLGFTGRKEGIAAQAVALLQR